MDTNDPSLSPSRLPFPIATYLILPDVLLSAVLAFSLARPLRLSFCILFANVCVSGLLLTTGDKMSDYSMGSTLGGQFFTAIHLLLLAEPAQYQHQTEHHALASLSRPFWKKMWWSACIIHSPRGIGWNYQVTNIQPPPSEPKWKFVRSRILRTVGCFLLLDMAQSYIHMNPLFTAPPANATISSHGWVWRLINGAAWMTTPYAGLSMQYYGIAALSVALGVSTPEYWIDPFGKWVNAYTVRNFWGKVWHQMMRRYIASIGKFVSTRMGFQQGSLASSYTQLYIGFLVSAVMHCFGDTMVGLKYMGASFPFFMYQAVAITAEDIAIYVVQSLGVCIPRRAGRAMGYVWVIFWMTFSLPFYIDWAVNAGLGQHRLLPISPLGFLSNIIK